MQIMCDVTHNRQPWYETAESGELYDTVQGTFAVHTSPAVNLNGTIRVPLVMDYTVDFTDTRLPATKGSKYDISGAELIVGNKDDANLGVRTVAPGSAQISPLAPLPIAGEIYHIIPGVDVKGPSPSVLVPATYMKWQYSGSTWKWIFYESYQNAASGIPITVAFPENVEQSISSNFIIYPVF
jgi:hypothetical protein